MIYFRKPLLEIIVKWTNEGEIVFGNNWIKIDVQELKKFIGVLILIGVYKSFNEDELWSKNNGRKIFGTIIARNTNAPPPRSDDTDVYLLLHVST